MASLEKTEANLAYSKGRAILSLAFSAAMASSVMVVSLAIRGDPLGMNWEPQCMIQWIFWLSMALVIYLHSSS